MSTHSTPLVGAIPAVVTSAEALAAGDSIGLLTQLGIGGVLVAFAVWLQDRFSRQRKVEVDEQRVVGEERTREFLDHLKDENHALRVELNELKQELARLLSQP